MPPKRGGVASPAIVTAAEAVRQNREHKQHKQEAEAGAAEPTLQSFTVSAGGAVAKPLSSSKPDTSGVFF